MSAALVPGLILRVGLSSTPIAAPKGSASFPKGSAIDGD